MSISTDFDSPTSPASRLQLKAREWVYLPATVAAIVFILGLGVVVGWLAALNFTSLGGVGRYQVIAGEGAYLTRIDTVTGDLSVCRTMRFQREPVCLAWGQGTVESKRLQEIRRRLEVISAEEQSRKAGDKPSDGEGFSAP